MYLSLGGRRKLHFGNCAPLCPLRHNTIIGPVLAIRIRLFPKDFLVLLVNDETAVKQGRYYMI